MVLTAASLSKLDGIAHGFFTRQGGVSTGLYSSLNCGLGSSDARDSVLENRARVARTIGGGDAALLTVHQIHSADAIIAERDWSADQAPKADALVTSRTGVVLGILTADCVPILFADAERAIVGAAHAGWKGAKTGVIEATVSAMERLGARRDGIAAAIGPAIRQRSYEVGPEFADHFADAPDLLIPAAHPGKLLFDLPGYVARRLASAGIWAIEDLNLDTLSDPERFYSHRRGVLAGEADYGRMITAIGIT